MQFDKNKLSNSKLINLYKQILLPRMIEEKMLILLRQNKISKWFSGIGQEAISVGATAALQEDEYILPMHRNLGVFTSREIPLNRLFSQFQGKMDGFTKGRDRSFHFGTNEFHIVGMISHLGPQLGVADGIALANKLQKEQKATLVFSGDGGSSEGDFHEALNVAAVWDLPVIFMIENNGYGLSTPSNEQFKFKNFVDKGPGYGMEAIKVDGNNILEVYHAVDKAAKKIRKNPKPILIEAMTFRMRGHEEASGTKYVPQELFDQWAKKDPVDRYEEFLVKEEIISQGEIDNLRAAIKADINEGLKLANQDIYPEVNTDQQIADLFLQGHSKPISPKSEKKSSKRYIDAISDGLRQSFEKYPELVIMGQDVADYGGVFKITEGFIDQFGKDRIRNTPLCESAIIGIGLGMSIKKQKSVIEMQFADFVTCGFNQIVNNLAKSHYRWGQNADVVVRMPTGAGVAAGPFHSQSNEAWFFHTPGLKIVFPSNPYEAKGLLAAAIEDPNPVMYFEHKALYRSITEDIPEDYYTCEIGKANIVKEGTDITIITYGMGVHWSKEAMNDFSDLSVELIDLRTLLPWDTETVEKSVLKTGKVLICNEDCLTGSISGEIAAWISENCFEALDAPIMREGSLDTPVPFNADLEQNFLPKERIKSKLKKLIAY
ncbi:2-oxoisovalerate dehydrogenase E1 component [Marivirga sericea]|uniref:2-oxoisovalerate dehydrogenase E1 component n=1 Tax=Marivirga sericea TaxID=1028 RepID=A0A1X7J906_9BACT|nr:dehydrogenase E1 component subunit alpha/beta [Marivirga sericea]SMG23795.1 2-oxoisovalerate dehydrogenase E1 component [Marivirga sericea]